MAYTWAFNIPNTPRRWWWPACEWLVQNTYCHANAATFFWSQCLGMENWLQMTGAEYLLPCKCSDIFLVSMFGNGDMVTNDWCRILTDMQMQWHFSGLYVWEWGPGCEWLVQHTYCHANAATFFWSQYLRMGTWLRMTGAEYLLPCQCSHIFLVFMFEDGDMLTATRVDFYWIILLGIGKLNYVRMPGKGSNRTTWPRNKTRIYHPCKCL